MSVNSIDHEKKDHSSFDMLKNFSDVAILLGVSRKKLYEILVKNKGHNYREFRIPKRNNGYRKIHSPYTSLKTLQRKLAIILNNQYKCHPNAHGFIKGKDILTNAKKHIRRRHILNLERV